MLALTLIKYTCLLQKSGFCGGNIMDKGKILIISEINQIHQWT